MPSHDVAATYRGYRLQALYSLSLILEENDERVVFAPEGLEDLAVFGEGLQPRQAIQVKAQTRNLTLSSFKPSKQDSFFTRTGALVSTHPGLRVQVATFGPVGGELRNAISGKRPARDRLVRKLASYGHLREEEARQLLDRLELVDVDESLLAEKVTSLLSELITGIDPDAAFDLLNLWLFKCSEGKRQITREALLRRLTAIGRFLAERAAHHAEWYTSIVPMEDIVLSDAKRTQLAAEFDAGVAARYEHIVADLDVKRHDRLTQIEEKFLDKPVVIVHGASGQGKTALACRYLCDRVPNCWRFRVELVQDRAHTLSIARALVGHAEAIELPLVVYLDVSPADTAWPELVKRLSLHPSISVLVTIREEDWRRASVSGADMDFAAVEVAFNRREARELYGAISARIPSGRFLDFEDAWRKFGGQGPLMEFVHLLTEGQSLRGRLSQQVARLKDEATTAEAAVQRLRLLRLVSTASAFGARLKVDLLADQLNLPEATRSFELLEKEYLLRLSPDGSLVEGLHQIRSEILTSLLTDSILSPWSEHACAALPLMDDDDIETFLLYAFSRRPQADVERIKELLNEFEPDSWEGTTGVLRALLWLGVRDYIEEDRPLIDEARSDAGRGWIMLLDIDIAGALDGDWTNLWQSLGQLLTPERRALIESLRSRQSPKQAAFQHARMWLSGRGSCPLPPSNQTDWSSMGETLFWLGRLEVRWPLETWLESKLLVNAIESLPLEPLADLMRGIGQCGVKLVEEWAEVYHEKLIRRFKTDTRTVLLEDDGSKVTAHFLLDMDTLEGFASPETLDEPGDPFNAQAVRRLELLAALVPNRDTYGSQGYGHRLFSDISLDSTTKEIPRANLSPRWLSQINSTAIGLAEWPLRTSNWTDYVDQISAMRESVRATLAELEERLVRYFRARTVADLGEGWFEADKWNESSSALCEPPFLPKCALDEWGFTTETMTASAIRSTTAERAVSRNSLASRQFKTYLDPFHEWSRALCDFFQSAPSALLVSGISGKAARTEPQRAGIMASIASEAEADANAPRISAANLGDAVKAVGGFQEGLRMIAARDQVELLAKQDDNERLLLPRLHDQWLCFAFQPTKRFSNSRVECPDHVAKSRDYMKGRVEKQCSWHSRAGLSITVLSDAIDLDGRPALCIGLDSPRLQEVYAKVEDLISAIAGAMAESINNEIRWRAFILRWPKVVLLPLLRGKLLDMNAYQLDSLSLLLGADEVTAQLRLVPQPITKRFIAELGLDTWDSPLFDPAKQLRQSVADLWSLLAHVRDLGSLPSIDDEGVQILQTYTQVVCDRITIPFEAAGESIATMGGACESLAEEELRARQNLVEVAQAVPKIASGIWPCEGYSGSANLDLDQLRDWADRSEEALGWANVAYWAWASDVAEQLESAQPHGV